MTNKTPKNDNKTARYDVQYTRPSGRLATRHNQTVEQIRALYNEYKGGLFTIWNNDTLTMHTAEYDGNSTKYKTVTTNQRMNRFITIRNEGWAVCDNGNGYKFAFKISSIATNNYIRVAWGC